MKVLFTDRNAFLQLITKIVITFVNISFKSVFDGDMLWAEILPSWFQSGGHIVALHTEASLSWSRTAQRRPWQSAILPTQHICFSPTRRTTLPQDFLNLTNNNDKKHIFVIETQQVKLPFCSGQFWDFVFFDWVGFCPVINVNVKSLNMNSCNSILQLQCLPMKCL